MSALQCKIRVAENGRKQVVKVMGDAPGETPEGLHLDSLLQPLLQLDLPRDVLHDLDEANGFPSIVEGGDSDDSDRATFAIVVDTRLDGGGRFRLRMASTPGQSAHASCRCWKATWHLRPPE